MGKNLLQTTNLEDFLQQEYAADFRHIFKTQEDFESTMKEFTRHCPNCGSWYWLSGSKRCECAYFKTINEYHHVHDHHSHNQ